MRITENSNFDTIKDSVRRSRERMDNLQIQASTTKKLNQPSDDPVGAAKLLEIRTDKQNNDQFQLNAKMVDTFLRNTDQTLTELVEVVVRAKEIALNQSSGANSSDETRQGVAEEASQLYQHAVALANRKVGERYLFGGFKTQKPPIDLDGNYSGDNGQISVEIAPDVFTSMNLSGLEAFNTHPEGARELFSQSNETYGPPARRVESEHLENVNLFDELQKLQIAVVSGELEGVRSTIERLDQMHSKLVANRVKVGSRMQGIQNTSQSIERHNMTNALLSSTLEDADMAQIVTDLNKEEAVLKNSLASSKRLVQPTLLDFLR